MQTSFDHDFLADVAQRIGDRTSRNVATEYMAHMFSGDPVSSYISEISENITEYDSKQN
jgi:hypothetical protein